MSKGLEALENLCNQCEFYQFEKGLRPKKCPHNKNCVFRNRIEKELKALEIIKNKGVNVLNFIPHFIISTPEYDEYQYYKDNVEKYSLSAFLLTEEEFDLLKEVLL